jgi:hypothetical protein
VSPLIIYHSGCYDGFTAAWVAHRALGGGDLVAAHYGNPPPDVTGRDVYIVDFSYPRDVLKRMAAQASSLLVLDHHATAAADLAGLPYAVFDQNESGASLTWRHFHGDAPMPRLVAYVRDRDLWRWELPDSRAVSAWLRLHAFDLAGWDVIACSLDFPPGMDRAIAIGGAIRLGEAEAVKAQMRGARSVLLAGVPFTAANCTHLFSETAGELAKRTGAGAVWFARNDGRIQWSLRGAGVDVSAVARTFGGGGHVSASGFDASWEEHGRLWGVA